MYSENSKLEIDTKPFITLDGNNAITQLLTLVRASQVYNTQACFRASFSFTIFPSAVGRVITHYYDCRRQHASMKQPRKSVFPDVKNRLDELSKYSCDVTDPRDPSLSERG